MNPINIRRKKSPTLNGRYWRNQDAAMNRFIGKDIAVGEAVPQVVRGPLGVIDIMAWYSAQQGATHYGGVHGDAIRYRQRHADYHINKKTGAKESAGRGAS